jgi:hypothetical protein
MFRFISFLKALFYRYVDFIRTAMLVISQAIYALRMTEKKSMRTEKKVHHPFKT